MSRSRWRLLAIGAAAALVTVGVLAGCGSSGNSSGSGPSGVLTVTTGAAGNFVPNFNPYSPNVNVAANGMIYEPLFYFNTVKSGDIEPWLGTSYAWSNGGRTVKFQLRHGVNWTDGKPFTSADVVYTFNLAIHNQALNRFALPLASVAANGDYAVTVNFTKPAYSQLYYAAGRVVILPQHVWQSISDPATTLNSKPIGTGAYTVSSVAGQRIDFTANPHYYFPNMPKFRTIRFLAFSGNDASDAAIESGQIDWAGSFIPNIKKNYLGKDPKFVLTNIPMAVGFLVPNMKSGPTASLPVRQAISAAINRKFISDNVYDGEAPPTNPGALLLPNFASVLDPGAPKNIVDNDAGKARTILQSAGYKLGPDGIFVAPDGTPLNITLQVISGYTDYVSTVQIIAQEAKAAGINLVIQGQSYAAFTADQSTGNFQLQISNTGYTPSPYSYYDTLIDSSIATPIGQNDGVGNYGRYANPKIDTLLADIAGHQDELSAKDDFNQIQRIFAQDLPQIPLLVQQDEIEFNGNHVTGFPTKDNPYAAPAVYMQPDLGWVAMRLTPAG